MNYGTAVGQDFDPHWRVNSQRVCVDVRAQRRGEGGYRAAIYLPSRAGQVRVAIDVPPGSLQALAQQYSGLIQQGEIAEIAGIDFLDVLPEVEEGPEFVEGLESLLGPALGIFLPMLLGGGGGGGGGGLGGLLSGLLGGLGGGGGGKGGGGGGGGLEQLLSGLLGGGGGQGGGGLGGVLGGLGQQGGAPPGAPGLGGLLGGLLGGIPILGPLLGPLFSGLGGGGGGPPRKDPRVITGAPTTYVQAVDQRSTPYEQPGGGPRYAGPAVVPLTGPAGGETTNPTGFPTVGDSDEMGDSEQLEASDEMGDSDECGYIGEIPPLEGTALMLGEGLGGNYEQALPYLTASHVLAEAVREVALNPHKYGALTPELEARLRSWLRASDTYAAAAMGLPEAAEAVYRAKNSENGRSALHVAKSLIQAPRY